MKLLVVDDDRDVRLVVEDYLIDAGYQVIQAEDGAQALALLDEHPSLRMMISDIRMPNMSGIEFSRRGGSSVVCDLRIIFISGYVDQVASVGLF